MKNRTDLLKKHNISFTIIKEEQAEEILTNELTIYNAIGYSQLFEKRLENPDKFVNLDFYNIYALAEIDKQISNYCLQICVQIETDLKCRLLNNFNEEKLVLQIKKYSNDVINEQDPFFYYNFLLSDYRDNNPYELISRMQLGHLIRIYKNMLDVEKVNGKNKNIEIFMELESVRRIRNLVAHSNSVLDKININCDYVNHRLRRFYRANGINKKTLKNNLSSLVIYDYCNMLDLFSKSSNRALFNSITRELTILLNEIEQNDEYLFAKSTKISSIFVFLKKITNLYSSDLTNSK